MQAPGEDSQPSALPDAPGGGALPAQWAKVEDFLRDYSRDLTRVADYAAAVARIPVRGLVLEARGPGVFLELTGSERRIGVLPPRVVTLPMLGGRQRVVLVLDGGGGLECHFLHHGDLGQEAEKVPLDLAAGSVEKARLDRVIREAAEMGLQPGSGCEAWEEPAQRLRFALETMVCLARIGRRMQAEAGNRTKHGLKIFNRAVAEITARHATDLRLEEVARAVGLSPRHFARMLQIWSGSGFTEHLLMARLMRARHRVVTGNATMAGIAAAAGFAGRDQFSRAFKQYFGWTPLRFRKRWHRAAEGREPWAPLLAMPGRASVEWTETPGNTRPGTGGDGGFHTLVVANAVQEIRVLQRLEADGTLSPQGALQPGQAVFFHRDANGSQWHVQDAHGSPVACFQTPAGRALAIIDS